VKRNWQRFSIEEVGNVYNGNSINEDEKKKHFTEGISGTPYIGTKDVGFDHIINYESGVKVPAQRSSLFKLAPEGCVLVCAEGGSAGRKVGFTDREVYFGNKLFAISPKPTINGRLIFYYCLSCEFQEHFRNSMAGLIGGVSLNKFKQLNLPLPELTEQNRIVQKLDEAFAGIAKAKENAEKNLQNARALFESCLQSVFTQRGPKWVDAKMDDVTELITCGVAKRPDYVPEGIPFLSAKNVKGGQVIWSGHQYVSEETHRALTKNNKPKIGDILYTRVGSYGEAAIIERDVEFSIFVSLTLIKPKPFVLNSFLKHYLNSSAVKEMAADSISGSGVGNLNVGTVRKFPIHLPPLEEQRSIVSRLDGLKQETQHLARLYQNKLEALESLKKSILHEAFSGNL
jgi:type I restriction enzyme S subunit